MPDLLIRMQKKRDGSVTHTCVRRDGSATWQRHQGAQARFFPLHDLTHYAVETVLGFRRGFYGLVAEGWDFADFGTPWPRGLLPDDSDPAELVAGFLDGEGATGETWSAAEMNGKVRGYTGPPQSWTSYRLTDAQLAVIRARRAELHARWKALPEGETLELPFEISPPTSSEPIG